MKIGCQNNWFLLLIQQLSIFSANPVALSAKETAGIYVWATVESAVDPTITAAGGIVGSCFNYGIPCYLRGVIERTTLSALTSYLMGYIFDLFSEEATQKACKFFNLERNAKSC